MPTGKGKVVQGRRQHRKKRVVALCQFINPERRNRKKEKGRRILHGQAGNRGPEGPQGEGKNKRVNRKAGRRAGWGKRGRGSRVCTKEVQEGPYSEKKTRKKKKKSVKNIELKSRGQEKGITCRYKSKKGGCEYVKPVCCPVGIERRPGGKNLQKKAR